MDNVYFKKLPSGVTPTVTGKDVIIAETSDGTLLWIDESGVKTLLDVDTAFRVGTILHRNDDISPASYLGGEWEKIAEGKVIIGASEDYPLNSTGGEATHTLTVEELAVHKHSTFVFESGGLQGSPALQAGGSTGNWNAVPNDYAGGGQAHNNLQPYIAKNIWQRIA